MNKLHCPKTVLFNKLTTNFIGRMQENIGKQLEQATVAMEKVLKIGTPVNIAAKMEFRIC